eukprot:6109612-Amphidinium_carterae.3
MGAHSCCMVWGQGWGSTRQVTPGSSSYNTSQWHNACLHFIQRASVGISQLAKGYHCETS